MSIHLTPQQLQQLDAPNVRPPRVIDPRTNSTYVLIPESEYEAVREAIEEERRREAIHAVALRNAAGRMDDVP